MHSNKNENTPIIMVSACLLGHPVRYDGQVVSVDSPLMEQWRQSGWLLPFCPEVAGGLPVPRPPAEIVGNGGATGVWQGAARVMNIRGQDVSAAFRRGAQLALEAAGHHEIRLAVLKERSPSCGCRRIYDGRFCGRTVAGRGVTTELLQGGGIEVFGEDELAALARRLPHGGRRTQTTS